VAWPMKKGGTVLRGGKKKLEKNEARRGHSPGTFPGGRGEWGGEKGGGGKLCHQPKTQPKEKEGGENPFIGGKRSFGRKMKNQSVGGKGKGGKGNGCK